jgi:ribosomal protein S18 acetylase RimI-like enzyme
MMLRRATAADLVALTTLQQAAYAPLKARIGLSLQPADADFALILADMAVWVAGEGGDLDAALILDPKPDHLLVWSIAVAPRLKGQGLGSALLDFAEAEAQRLGLGTMRLYTNARFVENIAWYERRGYAVERIEDRADRRVVHFVRPL